MTKIKLIDTIDSYINSINELETAHALAIDIETYVLPKYKGIAAKGALDVHLSSISTIQVKSNKGIPHVFDLITLEQLPGYDRELFIKMLEAKEYLLAHSASFETKFLKKYYGILLDNFWCTRVASQLITNATGNRYNRSASGNSLKDILKDYLDIDLSGKGETQIEDWYVRPLSMEKLEYGINDIIYLFKLKDIFESILLPEIPTHDNYEIGDSYGLGMTEVLAIEMQFIQVEAECEFNGLPINSVLTKQFEETIEDPITKTGEKLKVAGELYDLIGYPTTYPMDLGINYKIPAGDSIKHLNSSKKLKEIINKHIGTADTAESKQVERMLKLLDNIDINKTATFYSDEERVKYEEFLFLDEEEVFLRNQVARLLTQYKKLAKQASMRISKYINPITGRIHYNLNSLGAATGRCSSSNPNSQNINSKVELELKVPKENINELLTNTCSSTIENIMVSNLLVRLN